MPEPFSEQSRDRLLRAAIDVFAEKGFQAATIREICTLAEANVAAVNYYFRNKAQLYAEALAFAFYEADQRYPLTAARDKSLPAAQRLELFVRLFLYRILDDSSLGHHGKLIAREIADPTPALDNIVKTVIKPVFALLEELVPQLSAVPLSQSQVHHCVLSIMGQCLLFKHSRSIVERLCPEVIADQAAIDAAAAHIGQFSQLAISQIATSISSPGDSL